MSHAPSDESTPPAPFERSLVLVWGTRPVARFGGSGAGPAVLLPGPHRGWQVLHLLPGASPAHALVVLFGSHLPAQWGVQEIRSLSVRRNGSLWVLDVAGKSAVWTRKWKDEEPARLAVPEEKLTTMCADVAALNPGVSPEAVRVLLEDTTPGGAPLRALLSLLGMPAATVVLLDDDSGVVPAGELLRPADKATWAEAMLRSVMSESSVPRFPSLGRPPGNRTAGVPASGPAHVPVQASGPVTRFLDRFFAVVWFTLGIVVSGLGLFCLAVGLRPDRSIMFVSHPGGWVVMGVALVVSGVPWWRRGARPVGPEASS